MRYRQGSVLLIIIATLSIAAGLLACSSREDTPTEATAPAGPLSPQKDSSSSSEVALPLTPEDDSVIQRAVDGMTMLRIEAGEFQMGDDESAFRVERPAHLVQLDEYWMDQSEVSNAQYRLCVDTEACVAPSSWENPDFNADDQPALVTWGQAEDYCQWVDGRLPTEAEWEKGARGTDGRKWPWGNEFQHGLASLSGDSDGYGFTAPVGSFPAGASPYGLLDMAGNAAEWVADWYDADYYATSPSRNPAGPSSGEQKVLRSSISNAGGGPEKCRCTARYPADPEHPVWTYGFRCVSTAVSQP